jgi:hypothetical protein
METKAKIYTSENDLKGVVISGNVRHFQFDKKGWNLLLENSKTAEENAEFYDVVEKIKTIDRLIPIKECHKRSKPKSRAVIEDSGYTWIWFNYKSGYRFSLFTE